RCRCADFSASQNQCAFCRLEDWQSSRLSWFLSTAEPERLAILHANQHCRSRGQYLKTGRGRYYLVFYRGPTRVVLCSQGKATRLSRISAERDQGRRSVIEA